MTKLLLRLFVKNYENREDTAVRAAVGRLAGGAGIVCNLLLFIGKLAVGILSGSVAIIADAVNNLSDASSSVVTLAGFRLSQKPADKDHPFGHARYEYLSGLIVAMLILIIGIELAESSVVKIFRPEPITISAVTIGILSASILVKLWMMQFFRSMGRHIHSLTLEATAVDSRNDVISTAAVLLGCMVGQYFHINVDGYVGLAVALFILYSGVSMAKETISPLLGQQADGEMVRKIHELVLAHEDVLGVHDLLVHDYGPGRCFASLHLEIGGEKNALHIHEIVDHIEKEIRRELNVDMVIHYDPVGMGDAEENEVRQRIETYIDRLDDRLSLHDFCLLKGEENSISFDLVLPYELELEREELQRELEETILRDMGRYTVEIHFDRKTE
ncbi:MAG: cation diffusion facilitator family transporter [Bacillota bacterium]|nr:cation diffusion facilitator family transporter [Bacillota bacterium]